jgi:hypothetical protein
MEPLDPELPADPDLDAALELREASGQLWISGTDPATGEVYREPISRESFASALADARRRREAADDEA